MGKNTSYGTFAQEWVDYAASKRVADFSEILALPINEGRNVVAQADKMAKPPMNGVVTETRMIDMADGAETEVVIFSPSVKPTGDAPLVLVLHGGGWFLGDANSEAIVIATLVEECGAVVVASHYRLAPEHPFPTPLNDGYDAFLWALKNSKSLGADPDKFLVAGSSAGGNLAAALCIKAKMAGMSTKIRGQLLIYPVTCDYRHLPNKFELEGYNGGDLPVLPRAAMSKFWDMYNASNSADPLCSPLLAEDLSGLPPAHVQVAGADLLRDEGIAYAERLKAAGVPVRMNIFAGLPHGFAAAFLSMPSASKSNEAIVKNVAWLLAGAEGASETIVV